jgi:predicted permease
MVPQPINFSTAGSYKVAVATDNDLFMRYTFRTLFASPAFSLGAVACLSIGLACTIATFSVINAVLFRSMPGVRDQPHLRNLWVGYAGQYGPTIEGITPAEYARYRDALAPVAAVAAQTERLVQLQHSGRAIAVRGAFVSANYFAVLGTAAAIGRPLSKDDRLGVGFVSDRFWREHMSADVRAVGEFVKVNGKSVRVIGVAPPMFAGARPGELEDAPERITAIWLPLEEYSGLPGEPELFMFARPESRVGDSELQQRLEAAAAAAAAESLPPRPGAFARVGPVHQGPHQNAAETAMALAVTMSVPLGILAIACANVANLLLARASGRRREIAVRLAIGASRLRVVRELLAEAVVLALAAAVGGIGLCQLAIRAAAAWLPFPVVTDWRVALFAIAAALGTALAFGLLPALGLSRASLTMRVADHRRIRPWTRRMLVAGQIALSMVLLVVAALLTRTLLHITGVESARDERRIVTMTFEPSLLAWNRAQSATFEQALLERVRGIDGVEAAGASGESPFRHDESLLVRQPEQPKERRRFVSGGEISDGWLAAAGLGIVAGRDFSAQERRTVPAAAIVNETFARTFADPSRVLGADLVLASAESTATPRPEIDVRIVGIVRDGTQRLTQRGPQPAVYLPSPIPSTVDGGSRTLWLRSNDVDATALIPHVRAAAAQLAPSLPMTDVMTVAQARDREAAPVRWLARGISGMGLTGVALAGLGLYALLTYLVAQSHRELGIRLALGARAVDIVRLITGESAGVAASGVAAGSLVAALVALSLRGLFYGVSPGDPLSFLVAGSVLFLVALAASARPSMRASRTDPATVLRAE